MIRVAQKPEPRESAPTQKTKPRKKSNATVTKTGLRRDKKNIRIRYCGRDRVTSIASNQLTIDQMRPAGTILQTKIFFLKTSRNHPNKKNKSLY